MASSKSKVTAGGAAARLKSKRHFCPEHDEECKATMHGFPNGVMWFHCPKGCEIAKGGTVLK